MLLLQIADCRIKLFPRLRVHNKATRPAVAAINRRELKEVTTHNNLNTAERHVWLLPDQATGLVDHIQAKIVQHRNLINNQNVGFFDNFASTFGDVVGEAVRNIICHADSGPAVNGRTAQMRRGETRRCRYRHVFALGLSEPNKLI